MNSTDQSIQISPSQPSATAKQHARAIILITLVVVVLGSFNLGRMDIINQLESWHSVTVQEIVRDGNWLVPTINGQPRLVKPPLPLWVCAVVAKAIDGDHASVLVLRSVSVGVGVITAVLVYLLGCRMFDRRAGLWAGLVWGTSFLSIYELHHARHDIFLVCFITLAMLGIYKAWMRDKGGWWITAIGLILAFQIKGPVSWVFTILPAIGFALLNRPVRWRFIGGLTGCGLLAGVTLIPLIGMVLMKLDGIRFDTFMWEAFGRFNSDKVEYITPLFYLLIFGFMMPWSVYLVAAFIVPFEKKYAARSQPLRFAWMWFIVAVVFLSLPREKCTRYAVPLIAPLALLIGQILSFHIDLARQKLFDKGARDVWYPHAAMLIGGGIVGPGLLWWRGSVPIGVAIGLAIGLGGLGVWLGWLYVKRRPMAASVISVVLAGAMLMMWLWWKTTWPLNQEELKQVGPEMSQVVGDEHLFSWPVMPYTSLIYYSNRTAPLINNWFGMVNYYDDLTLDEIHNRMNDLPQFEKMNQEVLHDYLTKHTGELMYVICWSLKIDELNQTAAKIGFTAQQVMDLTTRTPRKTTMRKLEFALIRLTPTAGSTSE